MPLFSATYKIDERVYRDWINYPNIVRLTNGCTGTFVGPNLVLTAKHCLSDYNPINTFDNRVGFVETIASAQIIEVGEDWALAKVTQRQGANYTQINLSNNQWFNQSYLNLSPRPSGRNLEVLGFGSIRVMSDQEIRTARNIISSMQSDPESQFLRSNSSFYERFSQRLSAIGIPPLADGERLKASRNCRMENDQQIMRHSCRVVGGNSGGPVFNPFTNMVEGVTTHATAEFRLNNTSWATSTSNFYNQWLQIVGQNRQQPPQNNNSFSDDIQKIQTWVNGEYTSMQRAAFSDRNLSFDSQISVFEIRARGLTEDCKRRVEEIRRTHNNHTSRVEVCDNIEKNYLSYVAEQRKKINTGKNNNSDFLNYLKKLQAWANGEWNRVHSESFNGRTVIDPTQQVHYFENQMRPLIQECNKALNEARKNLNAPGAPADVCNNMEKDVLNIAAEKRRQLNRDSSENQQRHRNNNRRK
jgi:V8-like Glu-specific endopeptidase